MRSYKVIFDPCDTDFYKMTMKAAIYHCYPDVEAEFAFTCRTPYIDFSPIFDDVREQINLCGLLKYSEEKIDYLSTLKNPRFTPSFLNFLRGQTWNPDMVRVALNADGSLDIRVKDTWLYATDWEIWILAIISECWANYRMSELSGDLERVYYEDRQQRVMDNIYLIKQYPELKFVDFGTRRRSSGFWHSRVLNLWKKHAPDNFIGTSNIKFARALNVPVFGTHAHEWDSAHIAFTHPLDAKRMAMEAWLQAFSGDAGITLTDTFTTAHFLSVFNRHLANAFSGVRHDSGPWKEWGHKMIAHYESLGIDPKTKTLLFSDGLNFPMMLKIWETFSPFVKVGFGIGTKLTNDTLIDALQIVMKMVSCNGRPVLKFSDVAGKTMCEYAWVADYMLNMFFGDN